MKKLVSSAILTAGLLSLAATNATAQQYSWQKPHAKVLPSGGLEWSPESQKFIKGNDVRYIDFDRGDDSRDGKTQATAWKRHPLDPAFGGPTSPLADTFIFKRGVIYRGALAGKIEGTTAKPIILTSDPSWGAGDAVIAGSEVVTGWKQGADNKAIPEADKVWYADLDFSPRCVWFTDLKNNQTRRVPLAREPNWTVTDPEDVMSNWYEWEQPKWWERQNKMEIGGRKIHLGVDKQHLANRKAQDLVGGLVWTEWGIVMGTPFPTKIEAYDAAKAGVAFQGFWYNDSGAIITGNRYFLEDMPNFLDDKINGEFWFDKKGGGGRLYLRLPGDANPATVRVEAAKRIHLLDTDALKNVTIAELTFRFSNAHWGLWDRSFVHRDVKGAVVRCVGNASNVTVANCRFENVNMAVLIIAGENDEAVIEDITVRDNDILFTDFGAVEIMGSVRYGKVDPPFAKVGRVDILRNRLREIGHRPWRTDITHALQVRFAAPCEVAGNILERTYGSGVFIFSGKSGGAKIDAPFARTLIHHNRSTQALLAANDWGAIETWQGGPHYVFNNVSDNVNGYWRWSDSPGKPGKARLGFAYYLDGSYKNYLFNNIAWGANNDPSSKYANRSAFYQATPTTLNAIFNNTAYRFCEGSSWSPPGGREWFLGNLFDDISVSVFIHGKQKEDEKAVYDHYLNNTVAYGRNAFHKVPEKFGSHEGAFTETDFDGFVKGAQAANMLAHDVGVVSATSLLRDPANRDVRPAINVQQSTRNVQRSSDGGEAAAPQNLNVESSLLNVESSPRAVKFFVPWSLSQTCGEWQFRRDNKDPSVALDEHWWMRSPYGDRMGYKDQPRADLKGNVTAADYVDGPLEDWTQSALRIRPNTVLTVTLNLHDLAPATPNSQLQTPNSPAVTSPADWLEITHPPAFQAGTPAKIVVRLKGDLAKLNGNKLACHLHWSRPEGWGGYSTHFRTPPNVNGAGPYEFTITPGAHENLTAYNLLIGVSPEGKWEKHVVHTSVRIPSGAAAPPVAPEKPVSGLVVELYAKFEPSTSGQILKSEGLAVSLNANGTLAFKLGNAVAASAASVADGEWRHILCEYTGHDSAKPELRIYINGKPAGAAPANVPRVLPPNPVLTLGAGADMTLDFLRVACSSLEQSFTTIEELTAWQFDGPHLRDFTGKKMSPTRPAGALDY